MIMLLRWVCSVLSFGPTLYWYYSNFDTISSYLILLAWATSPKEQIKFWLFSPKTRWTVSFSFDVILEQTSAKDESTTETLQALLFMRMHMQCNVRYITGIPLGFPLYDMRSDGIQVCKYFFFVTLSSIKIYSMYKITVKSFAIANLEFLSKHAMFTCLSVVYRGYRN